MPRTKRRATRRRSNRVFKRRRLFKRKRTVNRIPRLITPHERLIKLPYVENFTMAPGVATFATRVYNTNSIFQPRLGGHQPLGYDQWNNFYGEYIVLKSTMVAKFNANVAGGTDPYQWICGVYRQEDAFASTTLDNAMEAGTSTYKLLNRAKGDVRIVKKFDPKKEFNMKNPRDEETLKALWTVNPERTANWTVWSHGLDETVNPAGLFVSVRITYVVLVSEKKQLAQSVP